MTDDNKPNETPKDNAHMTPEELRKAQEELRSYRAALDQEFTEAAEKAETTEAVMESTIDYFKKSVPNMAAQIVFLANNSTSDGVRLNASKWVIECVRKGVADSHIDPVNEILEGIFKNNDRETDTSDLVHDEREGEH